MVDFLTFISENSEIILMVISILLALIARYFQNQASAIAEAVRAVADLSQTVLESVKDGVISQEELNSIVAKIDVAKADIQAILDIFTPAPTVTEKFASVFVGFRKKELKAAINKAQVSVTQISLMKKKQ